MSEPKGGDRETKDRREEGEGNGGLGDCHSIFLMEAVWKAMAVIINCRFTASITYHNSLHGFQVSSGTRTVTLESNLFQKVAALR